MGVVVGGGGGGAILGSRGPFWRLNPGKQSDVFGQNGGKHIVFEGISAKTRTTSQRFSSFSFKKWLVFKKKTKRKSLKIKKRVKFRVLGGRWGVLGAILGYVGAYWGPGAAISGASFLPGGLRPPKTIKN